MKKEDGEWVKNVSTWIFGILMMLGLLLGIYSIFATIFNPNILNLQLLAAGWVSYLLFGSFIPD